MVSIASLHILVESCKSTNATTPHSTGNASCHLGKDHFGTYLQGQKFTLITDHRPLEKLGKVHRKTLNWLQEVMHMFDFDIIYKKGSEMPADYWSRNLVNAISWDASQLQQAQSANPLLQALKKICLTENCPMTPNVNQSLSLMKMTVSLRMTLFGAASKVILSLAKFSSFYQPCLSLTYSPEICW
jgi:hypothetical protein